MPGAAECVLAPSKQWDHSGESPPQWFSVPLEPTLILAVDERNFSAALRRRYVGMYVCTYSIGVVWWFGSECCCARIRSYIAFSKGAHHPTMDLPAYWHVARLVPLGNSACHNRLGMAQQRFPILPGRR